MYHYTIFILPCDLNGNKTGKQNPPEYVILNWVKNFQFKPFIEVKAQIVPLYDNFGIEASLNVV